MEKLLHFTEDELAQRRERVLAAMHAQELDGLLMFRQESKYYLTGYDTMGYITFQALFMNADGRLSLVTRAPDRYAVKKTSIIEDARIWVDREGATPADDVRQMLEDHGCRGKRIGIETDSFGLSYARGKLIEQAVDGFCTLVDATDLVTDIRAVKSPAEMDYVRRAGQIADAAMLEAASLARPGNTDLDLFAAAHSAIFKAGGDYPASRFTITSGDNALIVRHYTGHGTIQPQDQVTIELGGVYRHYHACLYRTVLTGSVDPRHRSMHSACVEAIAACREACKPGNVVGDIFAAYARTFDGAGYGKYRMNACGYSLGAKYPPTWMDTPMIFAGNSTILQPNMVFFLQAFLIDDDHELTMSFGESVYITEAGYGRLSELSDELIVN